MGEARGRMGVSLKVSWERTWGTGSGNYQSPVNNFDSTGVERVVSTVLRTSKSRDSVLWTHGIVSMQEH